MKDEANIKLLTVIHETQIAASDCTKALTITLAEALTDTVPLPVEGAMALVLILDVQSQLLAHLLEENCAIRDRLESFVRKLNSK